MKKINPKTNWFYRYVIGALVGSVLTAAWFHICGLVLSIESSTLIIERSAPQVFELFRMHSQLIIFQAMFVLIVYAFVGLPAFVIAMKLNVANKMTAISVGLIVGLMMSMFYGGVDISSVKEFGKLLLIFGFAGVIAAYIAWLSVRKALVVA